MSKKNVMPTAIIMSTVCGPTRRTKGVLELEVVRRKETIAKSVQRLVKNDKEIRKLEQSLEHARCERDNILNFLMIDGEQLDANQEYLALLDKPILKEKK